MQMTILNNKNSCFRIDADDDLIIITNKTTNHETIILPSSPHFNMILDALEWDSVATIDEHIFEALLAE